MIHIKTTNVVKNGENYVRVDSIKALRAQQLPTMYTADKKGRAVFLSDDGQELITPTNFEVMRVGSMYEEEFFSSKIAFINDCGLRLTKINAFLKEQAKTFVGVSMTYHI